MCPATYVKSGNTCVCPSGYVQDGSQCVQCTLAQCSQCATVSTCQTCNAPFVVSSSTNLCVCPNTYTQSGNTCVCPAQYYEFNSVCYNCAVSNCQACHQDNVCFTCAATFNNNAGVCQCPDSSYVISGGTCTCPTQTTLYNSHCYACNIEYCTLCQTDSVCNTCTSPFIPASSGGATCVCPATYVQSGNNCVCPNGYVENNGQCAQCTLQYCTQCATISTCSTCQPPFTVTSGACQCPSSYQQQGNNCICPAGTTEYNLQCIGCNPQYCTQCNTLNNCIACAATFVVNNGACSCPDSTFVIVSGSCTCPTQTTLYNNVCYNCNIQYCTLCQQNNICNTCSSPFVPDSNGTCVCPNTYIQSGNTCICPSGYVQNVSSCVPCPLAHCTECSSMTTCSQCNPTFLPNSDNTACICANTYVVTGSVCGCANNYTEYQNTCYQCSTQYCSSCNATNYCTSCVNNLVVAAASSGNPTCACPDDTYIITNSNCVCPTNTNLVSGTCVNCTVTNCQFCQTTNMCTTCVNNLVPTVVNGQSACQCVDTTFIIVNSNCVCPAATILNTTSSGANTCVACGVQFCNNCPTYSTCTTCNPTFVVTNNNTQCSCVSTYVVINNTCACPSNTT